MANPLDRVFARVYDVALGPVERRGLSRWRAELLTPLSGRVLEVGAGTGLNLAHYPPGVELVLVEPSAEMRAELQKRTSSEVIDARAENLPFPDGAFDAVVVGLVLCSVDDPALALAELRRVLRPGGQLVFVEHVRGRTAGLAFVQRLVQPVWGICGRGCRLTRDTEADMVRAGFTFTWIDRSDLPGALSLVAPAIHGRAVRDTPG